MEPDPKSRQLNNVSSFSPAPQSPAKSLHNKASSIGSGLSNLQSDRKTNDQSAAIPNSSRTRGKANFKDQNYNAPNTMVFRMKKPVIRIKP